MISRYPHLQTSLKVAPGSRLGSCPNFPQSGLVRAITLSLGFAPFAATMIATYIGQLRQFTGCDRRVRIFAAQNLGVRLRDTSFLRVAKSTYHYSTAQALSSTADATV